MVGLCLLLALPAFARCGDPDVLEAVEGSIREGYFTDGRPFEIYAATTEDWSFFLGNYDCWAVLRFEATWEDKRVRRDIPEVGETNVHFEFLVRRLADDWSKQSVTLMEIWELEEK